LRVSQYGLAQIVQDPECSKQAPISDRLLLGIQPSRKFMEKRVQTNH